MPASPLKWSTHSQPTVSQLYSFNPVKRKTSESVQPSLDSCLEPTHETQFPSKRVCPWPQNFGTVNQSLQVADSTDMMDSSELTSGQQGISDNHSIDSLSHQSLPNHEQSQQLDAFQQSANVQQHVVESQQQTAASHTQQFAMDNMNGQSTMLMNINDDDTEVDEYTSAYNAMDSEGAVDFSQYGTRVAQHEQHCLRSRSRSRGRHSNRKPSRLSRSPRRSRSRSLRKDKRSRSPKRYQSNSPRRQSRSPLKNRRRSRTPQKTNRHSRSPQHDRRQSRSPRRDRRQSTPPDAIRNSDKTNRRNDSNQLSPVISTSTAFKERRSTRQSRSRSRSLDNRRSNTGRKQRASLERAPSHSPKTLDDVLMSEKPLSKGKPSLTSRYDSYDINVMCLHNKDKSKRSSVEIDNDGSASDFFPTDVIELVHELNPKTSSKRKPKTIFDREAINSFVEETIETKVIRLAPSAEDIKKLEAKLSKGDSSRSRDKKHRDENTQYDKDSKRSKDLLRREPERRRYQVTDDDLLDAATSRLESDKDHKRSIQDRLGSSVTSDRDERSSRRIDGRLGRVHSERVSSTDLRHNLSSRGRDVDSRQAPIVRDYEHKSLMAESTGREREPTPDFSKRPDKGKVDMMELDPTYVPRGGRYDQHDDRTRDVDDWRDRRDHRDRGDWRGRGWGNRGRGSFNGRPQYNRNDDGRDRRTSGPRVMDHRTSKSRKPAVSEAWKHDKFAELEDDAKVEPTSTTA